MKPKLHNKILSILIFLLLIFGAIYYLYSSGAKQAQAPVVEPQSQPAQNPAQNNQQKPQPAPASQPAQSNSSATTSSQINLGNKQLQGTFSSGEGQPDGSAIAVWEVDFDGKEFSPASLDIKVNDWVFFKNKSQIDFWPIANLASAYPAFDAKAAVSPGQEFKFQFTRAGKWVYQDRLNPSIGGVVNVSQ